MTSHIFGCASAGTGDGPCFQARTGAPVETDLRQALDLISAQRLHKSESGKPAAEAEPREASGEYQHARHPQASMAMTGICFNSPS